MINAELMKEVSRYGKTLAYCGKELPQSYLDDLKVTPEKRAAGNGALGFYAGMLREALPAKFHHNTVFYFSGIGGAGGGSMKDAAHSALVTAALLPLKAFRVKIIRIGRSCGKFTNAMAASERFRASILTHYYLRDSVSLGYVKTIGIQNALFCPDMSWLKEHEKEKANETDVVMLNLRRPSGGVRQERQLLSRCAEIIDRIVEKCRFVPRIRICYQTKADEAFACEVNGALAGKYSSVEFRDKQILVSEMSGAYSDTAFVLSNRLHSLLFAYKYGAFPIAVIDAERDVKIGAILHDVSLDALIADMNSADMGCIDNILENRDELFASLLDAERAQSAEVRRVIAGIFAR